jgi:hypothetical protein
LAKKITTNIYGFRGERGGEALAEGSCDKEKARVFRLRSEVTFSGYLHRNSYAMLCHTGHGTGIC